VSPLGLYTFLRSAGLGASALLMPFSMLCCAYPPSPHTSHASCGSSKLVITGLSFFVQGTIEGNFGVSVTTARKPPGTRFGQLIRWQTVASEGSKNYFYLQQERKRETRLSSLHPANTLHPFHCQCNTDLVGDDPAQRSSTNSRFPPCHAMEMGPHDVGQPAYYVHHHYSSPLICIFFSLLRWMTQTVDRSMPLGCP